MDKGKDTEKLSSGGSAEITATIEKWLLERQKEEKRKEEEMRQKNTVKCIILFADLVGCSEISNEQTPWKYADILEQFGEAARDAFKIAELDWWKEYTESRTDIDPSKKDENLVPPQIIETSMGGDEVAIFLHPEYLRPDFDEVESGYDIYEIALRRILMFAFALKLNWLFSDYNIKRLEYKMQPRDIGIGIHCGNVYMQENRLQIGKDNLPWAAEGYAINLTKRIEGLSRKGTETNVLISSEIKGNLLHFSQNDACGEKVDRANVLAEFGLTLENEIREPLKGITTYNEPLFELKIKREDESGDTDAMNCNGQIPRKIDKRFIKFLDFVFKNVTPDNLAKVKTALEFYPNKWWLQAVAELGRRL